MITLKTEGSKIMFYRDDETDWFYAVKINARDEIHSCVEILKRKEWSTTRLVSQFIAKAKIIIRNVESSK